jgi:hypothetical protein
MKVSKLLFTLCCIAMLTGCSQDSDELLVETPNSNFIIEIGGGTTPDPTTNLYQTDLMAGQHILSGIVSVSLVNGDVVVTYNSDSDWEITETHLYIGPLSGLPTNGGGNPKIGRFPFKGEYGPGITEVIVDNTGISLAPGECIIVAAHAVVENSVTGAEETAWGYGDPIGGNSWAMQFEVCN